MNSYKTIMVKDNADSLQIVLNRVSKRNSLSDELLTELNAAMDVAEGNEQIKCIVLEGQEGFFCTGMDFEEAVNKFNAQRSDDERQKASSLYMDTLRRFSLTDKVVISKVDGQTIAGGIGIVAASDLVIASPRSTFTLSEALWGLLPACVTPYLIRRVGFQSAYRMTLTTMSATAAEAQRFGLVDEVSEVPDEALRKMRLRLKRVKCSTVAKMKQYFREMWIVDEAMERRAVAELAKLVQDPTVQKNLHQYITSGRFPWES